MSADWRLLFEVLAIVTMTVGQPRRADADQHQAHARVLVDRARRLPADWRRRRHDARRDGDADLPARLRVHAARRLRRHRAAAPARRRRRRAEGLQRPVSPRSPFAAFAMLLFMLSLGGIPPTAGFMGKFWLFGAAIESGLRLAGGDRRAEQRDLALLLHPHRRLHVSEEGDDRIASRRSQPGARRSRWRSRSSATLVLGVYPRLLFEVAEASARTLGAGGVDGGAREVASCARSSETSPVRLGEVFHKVRYTRPSLPYGR